MATIINLKVIKFETFIETQKYKHFIYYKFVKLLLNEF